MSGELSFSLSQRGPVDGYFGGKHFAGDTVDQRVGRWNGKRGMREERWLMTKPPTADCGEVVRAKALEEDILEVWENLPDLL